MERYKNGEIKNSFQNCIMTLSFDPDLRGKFCRNLLTERIDLFTPLPWTCRSKTINDTEMNYAAGEAASVLIKLLESQNESIRYSTATRILSMTENYLTATEILSRLEALEQQSKID